VKIFTTFDSVAQDAAEKPPWKAFRH